MEGVAITLFPFRALAGLLEGSRRPAIGQGSEGERAAKVAYAPAPASGERCYHCATIPPRTRENQARQRLWLIVGFSCAQVAVVLLSFRTARVRNQ
jgi:hypothetical protein